MNIEQYKNYLVADTEVNGENLDHDRCTYVWDKLYKPCYSNMDFWKNADFDNIKNGCIDYHGVDCGGHSFVIKISGDASFNFKKEIKSKTRQKYEYFKELIMQAYSGKEQQEYLNELKCCNLMFHSFHNFAVMPVTGAMNNFKGSGSYMKDGCQYLDRLDKFLYYMDQYYKDSNRSIHNPIFSKAFGQDSKERTKEENTLIIKNALKQFLDSIGSVYKYCEYFYLINDRNFIDRLVENGKTTIDSGKAVVTYMNLANDFWAIRHEIIKSL